MEKMLKSDSILRMSVYATSIVKKRKISAFLFHPFELEARLLHGFADIVLAYGARDYKRVGGRGGLAGLNAFQLAHRLLDGGLAVVAVHTLDGINHRPGFGFLFLEFVKEFHTQCNYDE